MAKIKIKEETERFFELTYYLGPQYGIDSSLWRSFCVGNEIEIDSLRDVPVIHVPVGVRRGEHVDAAIARA